MQSLTEMTDSSEPVHYDCAFPELPGANFDKSEKSIRQKSKLLKNCSLTPNHVREILEIPCAERRSQPVAGKKANSHSQLAAEISKQFGVQIDVNSSKSQSLTVMITGTEENVAKAKCAVVRILQAQSNLKMKIDPKYLRFIIGKGGSTLSALERETTTKINVPSERSHDNDFITIIGPKQGCDLAKSKIMSIVDVHSKLSNERLIIPKSFHPFIRGPRRCNINSWTDNYKVRIDMAPPGSPAEDICVSGDKKSVEIVLAEINKIYKTQLSQAREHPINVPKMQHRLVFGPKGSGLDDILEATGVSVELPADESDKVVLFGPTNKVGLAMTLVYSKASSSIRDEIVAPNRFHKIIIGKSGSSLASLLEGYQDRVRVEFGSQSDRIELEGPSEDVLAVKNLLEKRLRELEKSMAIQKIVVPSKYHGLIVGREGTKIRRIREKYNCQINLEQKMNETTEITLEGDSKGIAEAVAEINEKVKRLENEKVKDLIIEPQVQSLLRSNSGGTAPIRPLYDEYPKVTFHWPLSIEEAKGSQNLSDPSNQVCQLTGPRQDVDACAEKLQKLIKNVMESNYHQEFRLYKEFRQKFFSREVRDILTNNQCRVQLPPTGYESSLPPDNSSQIYWVIGREKQVHDSIDSMDALQRKLANFKEIRLPIPPFVQSKVVGDQAPRLRSIFEQCDGVSFKFPRSSPDSHTSAASAKDIVVYGPSEDVAKAQKLIEELNSKVAELCEDVVVQCDSKFHGLLIGRSGQNIASFRKRHNVELIFPDRYELNPSKANEIHILGTKQTVQAAQKDLLDQIKALENEIEEVLPVPSEFMRNVKQAFNKLPEGVRFGLPPRNKAKAAAKAEDFPEEGEQVNNKEELVQVKLSGPKAMVESTKTNLTLLINDLVKYSKLPPRKFPIRDKIQARVINRLRAQLSDLESEFRVIIKVELPQRDVLDGMSNPQITIDDCEANSEIGTVLIHGAPEQIDASWEQGFRPHLPVTEKFLLEKSYHKNLIINTSDNSPGKRRTIKQKSENVNKVSELQATFSVLVKIPPVNTPDADYILINGIPERIAETISKLKEWVTEWDAEKADLLARSYEVTVMVKECYLPFIMERKQNEWIKQFDISLRVNRRKNAEINGQTIEAEMEEEEEQKPAVSLDALKDETEEDEKEEEPFSPNSNMQLLNDNLQELVIRGYQEKVHQCKITLETVLEELAKQDRVILNIPQSVQSILIGAKRLGQLRLQQEFGVQIEFPARSAEGDAAHTVVVMGPKENVNNACDFLINRAQELLERHQRNPNPRMNGSAATSGLNNNHENPKQNNEKAAANKKKNGFVVVGAPWSQSSESSQAKPKTDSHSDFPSMNGH